MEHPPDNPESVPFPNIAQIFGILGIFIGTTMIVAFSLVMIVVFQNIEKIRDPEMIMDHLPGILFLGYIIPMFLTILYARWRKGVFEKERPVFKFSPEPLHFYLAIIILTVSFAIALDPLSRHVPSPEWLEDLLPAFKSRAVLMFLLIGIIGPVMEELLFRGIILDGLLKRYDPWSAIMISALFFGLIHLNLIQFIFGFVFGLLLGWVYWKSRSLVPAIIIHALNNSLSFLLGFRFGEEIQYLGDLVESQGLYLAIAGGSIIIFLLMLRTAVKYYQTREQHLR